MSGMGPRTILAVVARLGWWAGAVVALDGLAPVTAVEARLRVLEDKR